MKQFFIIFFIFLSSLSFAQQTDYVDFTHGMVKLEVVPDSNSISGMVAYKFDIKKPVDSIFVDAENLDIADVFLNNEPIAFNQLKDKVVIKNQFSTSKDNDVLILYSAKPKKAMYFVNRGEHKQVWTQGQGKYTSNWLPSIDDVNDKIEFDLLITCDKKYEVVSNGLLVDKQVNGSSFIWHYDMQKPMSSYLVALAVGNYSKKTETSKSGIPLEYYYYLEDSLKVEPTYRYSKQMFDYLEEEIAVPFPWQNYKQVPVHDFLYAGMENTSCTIFSDAYVVDSIGFNDRNYVNVNAHELAHQWFGDLVTAKSGEHHWLQEGFATYYALLAEKEIFGNEYFYFALFDTAQELGRQDVAGEGTSLLNPKSSSLTFYQRGAWVLHALRSKVGDNVFTQAVKNYLVKYQFSSAETNDFITEVEKVYGAKLTSFFNLWVEQKEFPFDSAIHLLQKQAVKINEYVMVDCEANSSKCAEQLTSYISDKAKVRIIAQNPQWVTKDAFKNSLKVRQAIAQYMTVIPKGLKEEFESLLDDKSYLTIESALYNLWVNFPEERTKYLFKTRNIHGFSDKNVRLLWIVLNLNTPFYEADNKAALYNELVDYTSERYDADLRINAFNYLKMIKSCDDNCKKNLENAKSHHNWRLVKFAKELSEQLQNKN
ncbi:M1 family metallopeptidase [Winogradskyella sp. SYSU M77433]|uniref:M1 family metallopeptidase n=1 Tax=Winogradskyella sp. SYSU M77433 TaxID=3042722 RepID=UPI00247FDEEA|nr:M1 family metallopeptidase [Winogradskyella sp. SYSU M77433]MDH7914364.1 M1 family metallopeptidase [Winogradskyella sp. SYSU M77433]